MSDFDWLRNYPKQVGEYWQKDNAKFDATNPSIVARAARGLNPVTGFGSALGDMYTSAGKGSFAGMALATADALPMFGFGLKTISGLKRVVPKSTVAQQLSTNELAEQYQNYLKTK